MHVVWYSDEGGRRFLWNVDTCLPHYKASHPRKAVTLKTPLWEPQITLLAHHNRHNQHWSTYLSIKCIH